MDSNGSETNLILLKDAKTIDDLDFGNNNVIHSETPKDIEEKCLQLCKDYLSGNWSQQTVDTIKVRRITGGYCNQLYHCAITKPSNDSPVPQEVAVRIYGKKWYNSCTDGSNDRLSDVIVSLMLSMNKLGPKVYALHEKGEIQHYYKHRQFKLDEQKDPKLVKQLFQKLARVHAMKVPLRKKPWILGELDVLYEKAFVVNNTNELIEELDLKTFKKFNIKDELQWIKKWVLKVNSPLVFSHNDLVNTNIMILDEKVNNEEQIIFCDYEYGSYGYRGQDLGSVLVEWGRLWSDLKSEHNYPDDSVIEPLIEHYIEENVLIFGKQYSENPMNSMKQLLKETKLFSMIFKILLILSCLKVDDHTDEGTDDLGINRKLFIQLLEIEYQNYFRLKKKFIQQNLFV